MMKAVVINKMDSFILIQQSRHLEIFSLLFLDFVVVFVALLFSKKYNKRLKFKWDQANEQFLSTICNKDDEHSNIINEPIKYYFFRYNFPIYFYLFAWIRKLVNTFTSASALRKIGKL